MAKRWVENTGSTPKQIGGQWVLPGSGVFVDEPDPGVPVPAAAQAVAAPGGQRQIVIDGVSYGLIPSAQATAAQALVSGDGTTTALTKPLANGAPGGVGLTLMPFNPWLAPLTTPTSAKNLAVWAAAVAAGTAKIAVWGTSIVEGRNQAFLGSTFYRVLRHYMRRAFPTLTQSWENFGIGGARADQALSFVSTTNFSWAAPSQGFYREAWQNVTATTASKAWKSYIQDFGPDLLFVEFGLNDTNTATYAASIQAIIDDVRSGGSWSVKRPSIVLVAAHTGTDASGVVYDNYIALRALAVKNGCPLIDACRIFEILTTGVDPESYPIVSGEWVGKQNITAASAPYTLDPATWQFVTGVPYSPTGTSMRDQTSGANPLKTLRKRLTRDGSVQANGNTSASTGVLSLWYRTDPTDPNYATDTGRTYEVRLSGTTVQAYYRASGGSLTAISGSAITLSPGAGTNTLFTIRVDYLGAWHRITVYEATGTPQTIEFYDFQYLDPGYAGLGISGTGGGFWTLGAIGNQQIGCVLEFWDRPPSYGLSHTDADLLGTVNDWATNPTTYGGNGLNHLTGPAHVAVYSAAIGMVTRQLQVGT